MGAARQHIRVACASCRHRRSKCDGIEPTCGQCHLRKTPCDYSQSLDRRTTRIAELEQEVATLRKRLASLKGGDLSSEPVAGPSTREEVRNEEDLASSTFPAYNVVDSLHVDVGTGEVSFMGPTSIPPMTGQSAGKSDNFSWLFCAFSGTPSPITFNISPAAHVELLDLYFRYLNGWSGFVDEAAFREGLMALSGGTGLTSSHPHYSPFLHLCILASGAHLSKNPEILSGSGEVERKASPFLHAATSLLVSELEQPKPTTVIGVDLLCLNLSDLHQQWASWVLNGIAIRLAQGLGLQINTDLLVERGSLDRQRQQLREDAYWSVYVNEKLVSLYTGRIPVLHDTDHDLTLSPQATPLLNNTGNDRTLQAALVTMCDIGAAVIEQFYSFRRQAHDMEERARRLRDRLDEWSSRYDPRRRSAMSQDPMAPPVMTTLALHNTIVILLNRPFLQRQCLDAVEGVACFQAALDTANLMQLYDSTHGMQNSPVTNSQNMHVAASLLVIVLADLYDQKDRESDLSQAQCALDTITTCLTKLTESWAIARQALRAVEAMRSEYAVGETNSEPFDVDEFFREVSKIDFSSMWDLKDLTDPNSGDSQASQPFFFC